jgi:PAS domain S-box-containing protein
LRLFALVTALVVALLVPAVYFVSREYYDSSLDLKRRETAFQGRVIALALQHQMLENKRELIREMISGFSTDPSVKRVMVVDHRGRVRLTNDPAFDGRMFTRDSPTCQVCHAVPSERRATSAVIDLEGGAALRSVYPLRNEPACHRCHDRAQTVNGVVITDTDISDLRDRLRADVQVLALATGVGAVLLLGGVTLIVRMLVLRRLDRIETTTRAIAEGDFERRVSMTGTDAVARLGNEFNAMADSVTDLLSQLRRQRTQLENVMSSVEDGMLVVDRTYTVTALNKSLAQRIGDTRENLLYRRCTEIWGPACSCHDGAAGGVCPARACFETGDVHKAVRTRYTSDGSVREEEVFASPILGADGEVEHVVEVWRDITQRKSREARMAEFQRLVSLGMLASGFSHEVNTPLGTMLIHVDEVKRLAGGDPALDAVRAQVEVIRSEILRCRDITRQFLQISRGRSVRQELLDVPTIVRATLPLAAHLAKSAGVTLRVVESGTTPVAVANAGAVQQVLLNIVLNAVQASRPGGEVRVHWDAGPETCIRIEDDGIGMEPEVREKVFEPFFSRHPSGTGLGLFVSLNLARQWGGDLRVSSEAGVGSAFEIVFPGESSWAANPS